MSGINYNLKKIRGVAFDVDGVLSPSTITMDAEGTPLRGVNIKDGYALQLSIKRGLHIAIITGADSRAVEVRYRSLGIKDVFTRTSHKKQILETWMKSHGLMPEEVSFVGDDVPDYECMQSVGLAVAPADACRDIIEIASYVSPAAGGYGVGRDLLEQILRAQGKWVLDAKAFGW